MQALFSLNSHKLSCRLLNEVMWLVQIYTSTIGSSFYTRERRLCSCVNWVQENRKQERGTQKISQSKEARNRSLRKGRLRFTLKHLREFKVNDPKKIKDYELGQELNGGEIFQKGDLVDVAGISSGKGFQDRQNSFRASEGHDWKKLIIYSLREIVRVKNESSKVEKK
eukprot:TRINITY_DN857_c1_g2_i5.p2 TRINITY_DN857_c1_g2~~TRINITY_DN857_c1_g2_i5.p2  ORF type:complete len:175 (+),score=6.79 TRINITY_DN857_c1_g2_i5:22-525(+)